MQHSALGIRAGTAPAAGGRSFGPQSQRRPASEGRGEGGRARRYCEHGDGGVVGFAMYGMLRSQYYITPVVASSFPSPPTSIRASCLWASARRTKPVTMSTPMPCSSTEKQASRSGTRPYLRRESGWGEGDGQCRPYLRMGVTGRVDRAGGWSGEALPPPCHTCRWR